MWLKLDSGKYKGKTLPEILFHDPDWFFHAVEDKAFDGSSKQLKAQVQDIDYKARHIKIPNSPNGELAVEYAVHPKTREFMHFNIVPVSRPLPPGSPIKRFPHIDMSIPTRIAKSDKAGCKTLIASLKTHLLGGRSVRISPERREAFFADAANFIPK